jgi:hypothetical protein
MLENFIMIDDRGIEHRAKFTPFKSLRISFFEGWKKHFINKAAKGCDEFFLIIHAFINRIDNTKRNNNMTRR